MKWLVNGEEVDLNPTGAEVGKLSDRLTVRTAEGSNTAVVAKVGSKTVVSYKGYLYEIEKPSAIKRTGGPATTGEFTAPMPGLIVDVLVSQGDKVTKGQKLLILEAMKTQQPVNAPFDGTIAHLGVQKGQQVREGELMISVLPDDK